MDGDAATLGRYPALQDEFRRALVNVERILARGRDVFFAEDETNYLAACHLIINVADIVSRMPDAVKARHPGMPWAAIRGTRNILAHNYTAADREIVWEAISRELPSLLRRMLGAE